MKKFKLFIIGPKNYENIGNKNVIQNIKMKI